MLSRRTLVLGLAGLAIAPRAAPARDFWGARDGGMPADFIFGYGTLINEPSRTATSKRRVPAVPARISGGFGYVRGFIARSGLRSGGGFTALGLRRPGEGEAASTINGTIFPVMNAEEMAAFDRREGGYDRVEVDPAFIEPAGWQGLPRGGRVWIYVPRRQEGNVQEGKAELPDATFPLVQSYIDVVLEGALAESVDFARELIATTFDWSRFWIDDRPVPRRPWSATPEAGAIDRLLATVEPAASRFRDRLLPELYAARHLVAPPGIQSPVPAEAQ